MRFIKEESVLLKRFVEICFVLFLFGLGISCIMKATPMINMFILFHVLNGVAAFFVFLHNGFKWGD